ncbi:MAG: alpha/beta fold hydrolase, partial [Acidimicrobiia bacterium]
SRLVLIGVTPSMSKRPDWAWGFMMDPVAFQDLILADHEGVVRQVIADLLLTEPDSEEVEEMVRSTMLTPPLAGSKMLEDHGVIDWRDMLETITIPTLVCVGRFDRNAPLPAAEHVADAVPNGRLVVFEQSAHAPFYEEPEEFNRVLEEFLDHAEEAEQ